jgi:anti-anti-sigma factor
MTTDDREGYPGSRPAGAPTLVVMTRRDGSALVVVLRGELDLDGTEQLRRVVRPELDDATSAVTLDFTELSFVDSAGLQAVLDIRDAAEDAGIGFTVRGVQPGGRPDRPDRRPRDPAT